MRQHGYALPLRIRKAAESFIVEDAGGVALAYVYFEEEPTRRALVKRPRSRHGLARSRQSEQSGYKISHHPANEGKDSTSARTDTNGKRVMAALDEHKLFTRQFDREKAREQFRVSLLLVVVMTLAAFVLGFALPIDSPAQKATPVATDNGVFAGRLIARDGFDERSVTIDDRVTTETNNIGFILVGIAIGGLIIWLAGSSKSQKTKTIQTALTRDQAAERAVKNSLVSMETISCTVVLLTVLALVAQALFPDFLNGVMLPLATTTWFILYRLMANRIQGRA